MGRFRPARFPLRWSWNGRITAGNAESDRVLEDSAEVSRAGQDATDAERGGDSLRTRRSEGRVREREGGREGEGAVVGGWDAPPKVFVG